jgi:tRNA (adenine37-N6)-methyltransferase
MKIEFTPIGVIHSPYTDLEEMPIQPAGAKEIEGSVEVFEEYRDGLQDLDGFSHIILLYWFHRSRGFTLKIIPFLDSVQRGLFATRAPKRPNPIGLSVVRLNTIKDGVLYVRNIDILNKTPLLDIKPYVPEFDIQENVRTGWLEKISQQATYRKSDDRFR